MSQTRLEKLTPEQEALIPVYREKWRQIAFATEPIDRQKATEAIEAAYASIGFKQPEILFCDSPSIALKTIFHRKRETQKLQLGNPLSVQLQEQLEDLLDSNLVRLHKNLRFKLLSDPPQNNLIQCLNGELRKRSREITHFYNHISPERWSLYCSYFSFCISVLDWECDRTKWLILQSVVKECGWIYPFESICLVCDRPVKVSFDSEQRLHAEGESAIQFSDGFSLYAHHGLVLPEEYGKLHPREWQSQWLLEEDNAELRRVLIQGIGYARICTELQATELDNWQEYTLLKIDKNIDVEPIHLLKMTCPSIGYIHALRVSPSVQSAREAIIWANWGTAPEEFSIQS
jgi:hypothetical protein